MHRHYRPTRCGFTLIEMIVVIIVMAIMASLTLPRLFGNDRRQFQHVADQVSDLLMMYAQRVGRQCLRNTDSGRSELRL